MVAGLPLLHKTPFVLDPPAFAGSHQPPCRPAERFPGLLNGQTHAYDASARLLADLRLLKWTVRADNCGIERQHKRAPRKVIAYQLY